MEQETTDFPPVSQHLPLNASPPAQDESHSPQRDQDPKPLQSPSPPPPKAPRALSGLMGYFPPHSTLRKLPGLPNRKRPPQQGPALLWVKHQLSQSQGLSFPYGRMSQMPSPAAPFEIEHGCLNAHKIQHPGLYPVTPYHRCDLGRAL